MPDTSHRTIALWLFCVCALIFMMVIVGGITRLTESGLSMVQWRPISGIIPPISHADWNTEFEAYKQFPEYQKVNSLMSLSEFKSIFLWEFLHRLLGRFIGLAFFLPFLYFLVKKRIAPALKPKLWALFGLGACQGILGWWMVKSGLIDRPDVSHYRLSAHLGLAVLIYMYMFWLALGLVMPKKTSTAPHPIAPYITLLIGLIFVQILLGGLVAGLKAGMIYTNWPWMGDSFIPDQWLALSPWYMNFLQNVATVQLDHRMLGYGISAFALYLWWRLYRSPYKIEGHILIATITLQILLGIFTLLYVVPLPLAVTHQAGAIVTLSVCLIIAKRLYNNIAS